jgi:hypothetical protein
MQIKQLWWKTAIAVSSQDIHHLSSADNSTVLLTDPAWKQIRDAIQNAKDIVIPLEQKMKFRLEWQKNIYHNPIDGTEINARWKTYRSNDSNPAPPSDSHVVLSDIVLLTQVTEAVVPVDRLNAYIKEVVKVIERLVPVTPLLVKGSGQLGRQIVVEIEVPKVEGWLKMSAYPSLEGLPSQQILPEIARLAQPPTQGKVKFQLMMKIWGYDGLSAHFS